MCSNNTDDEDVEADVEADATSSSTPHNDTTPKSPSPMILDFLTKPTDKLDIAIAYLRRVHFVNFYGGRRYRDEVENRGYPPPSPPWCMYYSSHHTFPYLPLTHSLIPLTHSYGRFIHHLDYLSCPCNSLTLLI